jgi:branched-chain amino acid transport system permease protein
MVADFLQYLFDGLSTGAIYSLLALGLVIVYRGTGHLNFAQGEMAMLSAFMAWWLSDNYLPIWLSVFVSMAFAFALGALVERVIIRPIGRRSVFAVGVAAIGLLLGFNALAPFIWKVSHPEAFGSLFPKNADGTSKFVSVGGAHWRYENIGVLAVMLVVAAVLFVLFQKTKLGLAMRAVASNPESAPLAGIKTGQVLMISWGLAAAVGAMGGAMVASLRGNVDSSMMLAIFFSATAAAMLGGFDSLIGAVIAGLLLGIIESMGAGYQPDVIGQELKGSLSLVIILVVLLFRPSGLFGTRRVERV